MLWRLSWSVFVVAVAALTLPAQEPNVETGDPALASIRAMLKEAEVARSAGKHEDARRVVREALAARLVLPGLADRKDAHDLLFEIGEGAERAAELRTAHDAYQRVCDYRMRTLPDDHPDLQRACHSLAAIKHRLGDLAGASALKEKVYDVWRRTLPDDHTDLQAARASLAVTKHALGDLTGARVLREQVYEVRSRTLPDDHPDLQRARQNLANTKHALGDLDGARALHEKVYEVCSRTLPGDHPDLQAARNNLAVTKHDLGDVAGARVLRERVYEVWSRTLPDDHPDLQAARANLAVSKHALGDLDGARALLERVCAVRSRTLPDDHPDLQRARQNLAATDYALGDLDAACALQQKVYEVRSRTLLDDHADLQTARQNLAATKDALGDPNAARALFEKVYEVRNRTLPDDHPDLQRARGNLAITKRALGDLDGARALQQEVYDVRSRTLPSDHPQLQSARQSLALTHVHLGNASTALRLATERGTAARRRLASQALSPREFGAMAAQESAALDLLLTLADGFGTLQAQPDAGRIALETSQALRGVQTRVARASRRARSVDAQRAAALESDLRAAAADVSRAVGAPFEGKGEEFDARRRARVERLIRAVQEKERLERELGALAAEAGHVATVAVGIAELAARLPERSAAAAIVGYMHARPDPEHAGRTISEPRLAGLVLGRDAELRRVAIGPVLDLQAAVDTVRDAAQPQVPRGQPPVEAARVRRSGVAASCERLRQILIAPLLSACGPIDTLYVAVDELLELVPLDALPLDADHLVGERVAIRPLVSLFDLLERQGAPVGEAPELLVAGGLDYGRALEHAAASVDAAASAPVVERSGGSNAWTPLPGTAREVDAIAALFAQAFVEGTAGRLVEERAGKAQIAAAAAKATFVHLATHGYFAPETVKSTADATTSRDAFGGEGTITGLSPLVLCGLALSGANLPPDDLGRRAGILTAEEILSLDLSKCYLVTLSACDTSLGVRRAGQGYASLRAALQGAGARYVLTSLWKVGDEATMELMVDFYRRLWVRGQDPHAALWQAKMAARKKGAPFRDWAGWVLTGR